MIDHQLAAELQDIVQMFDKQIADLEARVQPLRTMLQSAQESRNIFLRAHMRTKFLIEAESRELPPNDSKTTEIKVS